MQCATHSRRFMGVCCIPCNALYVIARSVATWQSPGRVTFESDDKRFRMENKIKIFEQKQIRTVWNADEEEWYFSVVDIVSVLTDNDYQAARNYWKVLRKRLSDEGSELVTNCNRLKKQAFDGKMVRAEA